MKRLASILSLLLVLLGIAISIATAEARGGRGSDDCPPKSTDPDCQ
jgi:hypothetical protein